MIAVGSRPKQFNVEECDAMYVRSRRRRADLRQDFSGLSKKWEQCERIYWFW